MPAHLLPVRFRTVVGVSLLAALALASIVLFAAPGAGVAASSTDRPLVIEAPISGPIDPVTLEFVQQVISDAEASDGADLIVFTMDTPGGLSTSMDDIIKEMLNAKDLPIVVYVAPKGARAASAGAFILMASDVAAMAPSTNVGSATPIQGSGKDIDKDLRTKVVNDYVAKIRALARDHGRDVEFAEEAVRDAANIDEEAALKRNVVEFVADDLDDLLQQIDGYKTVPKDLVIETTDAHVEHRELSASLRLLKVLIDPNILFLLFAAGTIGLAFEITHPGSIFPGVVGAICMIVALFGFQVLPINMAGVVLLLLGLALFIGESMVFSHGVLGAGGAVSVFLGGLLLFDRDSPFAISIGLLVVVSLLFLAFFGLLVRKAVQARRATPVTGSEWLVGQVGTVRREIAPNGTVFVSGELWSARLREGDDRSLPAGSLAEVLAQDGLTLEVRAAAASTTPTDTTQESPPT